MNCAASGETEATAVASTNTNDRKQRRDHQLRIVAAAQREIHNSAFTTAITIRWKP